MTVAAEWRGVPSRALLRGKLEDRFTAYLCELLRSPEICQRFATDVCGIALSNPSDMVISAPWLRVPGGCPDIAVESRSMLCIVEAKVDSALHDGQLVPYARHLVAATAAPARQAVLVVLGPRAAELSL